MKCLSTLIAFLFFGTIYGQSISKPLGNYTSENKKVFSSLDISLLSLGFNMDYRLSEKKAIGFNFHFGFHFGYFVGVNSEFNDRASANTVSLIALNLKMNQKYSKIFQLDYGVQLSFTGYNVPSFDGLTQGNFIGLYVAPWIGEKVKFGVKVAMGHAHVDGGDNPSLNSFGLYNMLLYMRIPLYKSK
jgi:hypothetical protein